MLDWSVETLHAHPDVASIVVVAPAGDVAALSQAMAGKAEVVAGGATRQQSVGHGLAALPADARHVLVHDAARPLLTAMTITSVVAAMQAGADAVIPVLPVVDTVKRVDHRGQVVATLDRAELRIVQTPQGFRRDVLVAAHRSAADLGMTDATDDAGLVESIGRVVATVAGSHSAFKITTPDDLAAARRLVEPSARAGSAGPHE